METPFLDVVNIPMIGALVYQHLSSGGRKQARLACRALCTLVDTNIEWLELELPDTPEKEHQMGLRLKQRRVQPKDLSIIGRKSKNNNTGEALAAAGLDFFMHRVQEVSIYDSAFSAGIVQVLALSKCGISSMELPATGNGWQMVGQFTALRCLTIGQPGDTYNLTASQWQALSSLACLTSLVLGLELGDFSPLTHLTQLTHLSLLLPEESPVQHPEALSYLTALESLDLGSEFWKDFSMHDSVAAVVAAISSLRKLVLPDITRGPWTEALARLTGLTQLTVRELGTQGAPHPIHLPSVRVLTTLFVTARQLALITAPSLTRLEGVEGMGNTPHIVLCGGGQGNNVAVAASGLLRHCKEVCMQGPGQAASHATLAALCRSWRPSASVMGSDPASRVWALMIADMEFGQAEAALVPNGITHVTMRGCTLSPGSLAPLAQLSSLRELSLMYSLSPEVNELEQLLSSAVQGKSLRIHITLNKQQGHSLYGVLLEQLASRPTEQEYRNVHSRVVAVRGEDNTPRLDLGVDE